MERFQEEVQWRQEEVQCRDLGSRSHVPVSPRGESTWRQRRRSSRSLNFAARCCLTAGSSTNSRGYRQIESRSDTPPLVQDWGQPTSSWTLLAYVASRPNPVFNSNFALLEQALEDLLSNNSSLSERYKYQASCIHEATAYTKVHGETPGDLWKPGQLVQHELNTM